MDRMNGSDFGSVEGESCVGACSEKEAMQSVQVALNIRPLISAERIQGCKDCISVVPGEPQVQIGSHSFTFDHVFGSTGTPLPAIFDKCVVQLVEGLFHGYNATVLAYGQTGSGKTYTMGTGYRVGGSTEGVIPQVMETIFKKIEILKERADFQLRVSFIEILKEEVHDLLDPNPPSEEISNGGGPYSISFGGGQKTLGTVKPPIQIRETGNGGITLAGVTESDVNSLVEMAACLEQGSLCRATGSTNMNSCSSRSHAIFTITLEQRRKWEIPSKAGSLLLEDSGEDYLCAKLHLVDLAGSERAKRTGADGIRFKEGVHINKGLLALGNVISALGDDKKRKEGGHVPYRDSKLTRLLQDSLGGNSRTVMIACVSPADSNAEETLNTLKYANRARNIQNKPTVNRDPMAAEMQRMRQQLEVMRGELICAQAGGPSSTDIQMLKQKIVWLEASNASLQRELQESLGRLETMAQHAVRSQVERDKLQLKLDQLRAGKTFEELDEENDVKSDGLLKEYATRIQQLECELQHMQSSRSHLASSRHPSSFSSHSLEDSGSLADFESAVIEGGMLPHSGETPGEAEAEAVTKEWEHTMLQENLDKELQELNQRLEQKEAEMKTFVKSDAVVLKQHFERKLLEMEEEKKTLQRERDTLMTDLESLATASDETTHKMQETYMHKLKQLESQIADLKKKQDNQSQLLRQKQRSDEASKRLQEEIHRIKTQKVQLQQKIKQESEQFRLWKAAREKEVLQLRKEGRRNVYEMHKLQAQNQRQKMVLQRKTEQAAMATRRLKEVLEAKSAKETAPNGLHLQNGSAAQQWLDQELEVEVRVHEVRSAYQKHMEERAAMAKERLELMQGEEIFSSNAGSAKDGKDASPTSRQARIIELESMLTASSSALVAMASQLSEAEERQRVCSGRARWKHLHSTGDFKSMLDHIFRVAASSSCQVRDKEEEAKELKEKLAEVEDLLRQSEAHRKDLEHQQRVKEQAVAVALATTTKIPIRQKKCNGQIAHKQSAVSYRGANQKLIEHGSETGTELESDMEISEGDTSDEDWQAEWERRAARRNRVGWYGGRVARRQPLPSSGVANRKPSLEQTRQVSFELGESETSCETHESRATEETLQPSTTTLSVQSLNGHCCSCSQSSGCKTKKCECRAANGLCGPQCGCKAGRCANRDDAVALDATLSSSLASLLQDEMLRTTAPLQACSSGNNEQTALDGNCQERGIAGMKILSEVEQGARRAERAMATQAASLLDNAWKEEQSGDGQDSTADEDEKKRAPRRPLADVGNKVLRKHRVKLKRKVQRALVQLVPVSGDPNLLSTSGITSTTCGLATVGGVTTNSLATASSPTGVAAEAPLVVPHEEGSGSNPLRMQSGHQRRTISPQLSPLRSRHNTLVGDSLRSRNNTLTGGDSLRHGSGLSTASSSHSAGIRKNLSAPGSPGGSVQAKHEKENIRSTLKDSLR